MTVSEIIQKQKEIYTLLAERRLKESFERLNLLVTPLQDWQSTDKLNEMETSYRYMIQYMLDGAEDPERKKIYDQLVISSYRLTDRVTDLLLEKESTSFYYSHRRYLANHPEYTLAHDFEKCDNDINNLSLASLLDETETDNTKLAEMKRAVEKDGENLFINIWTNYPAIESDYMSLKDALTPNRYPENITALIVSALTLNLMHRFNEQKLLILLDGYNHNSEEVQLRALCGALIILYLYKERLALSEKLKNRIDALKEDSRFNTDVRNIFLQFIKSRETEKISRKLKEELLPQMMKISPSLYKKIKQEDLMNDMTSLDKNPEWQEMLEKSGIEKKMKELNDLQMEGADVFMSTFAQLKNFPFFNEIGNWFLPFTPDHSALRNVFGNNSMGDNFKKIIDISGFLCNSDKYSFCLTLTQVPENQRQMMMSQFGAEGMDLKDSESEELYKAGKTRENISNRYIQDLYRFFKLYNRRGEFEDPFITHLNLLHVPLLESVFSDDNSLRLIGEYYFKREYYDDALELFEKLSERYHSDSDIYQKIGYCYQMTDHYAEALEAYLKAEIINPNSFWTIRRIATCYRNLKKPEMALDYYHRAEKIKPDNLSVEMNIGHCYLEQKDYEAALRHYFKVDYLDPKGHKAWRPIAWCSFLTGKSEQALRYYEKILEDKPTPQDYLNAGHAEFSLGHIRKAIEYYRQSIIAGGGDTHRFMASFKQDMNDLLHAGIPANDIPILLDQLMYSMQPYQS